MHLSIGYMIEVHPTHPPLEMISALLAILGVYVAINQLRVFALSYSPKHAQASVSIQTLVKHPTLIHGHSKWLGTSGFGFP